MATWRFELLKLYIQLSKIRLTVLEMSFEDFQDVCHGGHLGYSNGIILAILNFPAVSPIYGLGGDDV